MAGRWSVSGMTNIGAVENAATPRKSCRFPSTKPCRILFAAEAFASAPPVGVRPAKVSFMLPLRSIKKTSSAPTPKRSPTPPRRTGPAEPMMRANIAVTPQILSVIAIKSESRSSGPPVIDGAIDPRSGERIRGASAMGAHHRTMGLSKPITSSSPIRPALWRNPRAPPC